jgi:4-alpha-glucanotransferase
MKRASGVTIPLFSVRSRSDWGIGQITDLPACAEWFLRAGQRLVQVLPTHELADGETSPYGALSAFAIDPIYIDVERVPELDAAARARALGDEGRAELDRVRALAHVDYKAVRSLKRRAMSLAFHTFRDRELAKDGPRAKALAEFIEHEKAWLRDHALYMALRTAHEGYGWSTWPENERNRSQELLAVAEAPKDDGRLGSRVLEQMYLQLIAHEQWQEARSELKKLGVALMGDMPYIVGSESADVWAHRDQFLEGVTLGAPPDDFAPDGQSWGLPAYDWKTMDGDDLGWLRARAEHSAELFDRFRIDHLVGFFRQWVTPVKAGAKGAKGHFDPAQEKAQLARGEKVLRAMMDAAGKDAVIAEDLGVIPDFVRATMKRLGLPGYKVLPWERDGSFQPYDPRSYPEVSVATWSTHDTAPITQWWYDLHDWERERIAKLDGFPLDLPEPARELALLKLLLSAKSELTLMLAQEILGDKTRINTPGTVNDENWTWRLPRPIEDLREDKALASRFGAIRSLVAESGRL